MRKQTVFTRAMKLMGNHFEFSVVGNREDWALERIEAGVKEVQRIERLLTTFSDDSETNLINSAAGIAPVKVSQEVFELIERCSRLSRITRGAFDITYGSIDKRLWNFDQSMTSLPSEKTAKKMVRLINFKNIVLDRTTTSVMLKEKGMRIGFGGIGKGYAAERAKAVMREMDVQSGVVNASGDLTAWGYQPGGRRWTIGIVDPDAKGKVIGLLDVTDMAVATSGNYEKFALIDGKRYSHTINPRTGLPVTGIKSVTVVCPYAEIADAMATPVMVMGVEAGMEMINQLDHLEAVVIDDDGQVFLSNHIQLI
jgi:thiamine biosynthesis lipoprotein